ncbi:MAG: DsbA family protein [Stellaceae bacterium]
MKIFRAFALVGLCLLAGAPASGAADNFTPAQTKELERIVHDYIVKHPDVLMEALQAAEEREKADKVARAEKSIRDQHNALYNDPESQIGGNPHGDVTIVEFFDYRCPYCKQVQPVLEGLLDSDRNLRIVYKEFPILGPASAYASKIALASRAQGKYNAFHRAMMETKGSIDEKVVDKVALSVGIDLAKAKADMAAPAIEAVIKKDFALADAINVNGTPAFIIAGKLYPGAMTLEELKKLIADARQAHDG